MNQHDYVKECLTFYEEEGFIPGAKWEDAHYPAPRGKGDTTIPMLHGHHQVQGLWQSKEYGQCCFYIGHAKRFLTEGPFVTGWFELWDIYDKYSGENARKAAELGVGIFAPEMRGVGGKIGGKKIFDEGLGIFAPGGTTPETRSRGGRVAGKKTFEEGLGVHGRTSEEIEKHSREGGKKASELSAGIHSLDVRKQKYQNTHPDHPPFVSNAAGLARWQKVRGIDTTLRIRVR